MFHIDVTFENTRIIAKSEKGEPTVERPMGHAGYVWDCTFVDNYFGTCQIQLTWKILSAILDFNFCPSGHPEHEAELRAVIGDTFNNWPADLCPIP